MSIRFWYLLGFISIVLCASGAAQSAAPPTGLLCNLLAYPEKALITDPRPEFSWIVNSKARGAMQEAYQIVVASSPENAGRLDGDLWDTGRVTSGQSINVDYAGKPLAPHSSYWWRVRTWDQPGPASDYSVAQRFNTGEFGAVRKWPGESRWVQIPGDGGQESWGFEDRHPVDYHPVAAVRNVHRPDGSYFLDFGRAAFATLRLTLTWNPPDAAAKELPIEVAVGEKSKGDALDPKPGGGIIYRKYPLTIQTGTHQYTLAIPRFVPHYPHSQAMPQQMPDVVPFRYCEIRPGIQTIELGAVRQLALWVQFDDSAASFDCSSKALNDVYNLCHYSLQANTFNGDYAASERERMLYEADAYIQQMGHYAIDREFAIARYSAVNLFYHATWPTEWISHDLLMAWADYLHTGNTKLIVRNYEELKPKTLLTLARPDGLISTRTGLQSPAFLAAIHGRTLRDIVDWPTSETDGFVFRDYNTVVNAFCYRGLVLMAQIARTLQKEDDAAAYRDQAAKLHEAFNQAFLDTTRGIYVDGIGTSHASLHANLFALAFGLVPESHRKGVVDFIKTRGMACSVYPANYLLEALYDAGEDQYAQDLMTADSDRSWLNMIRMGSTITTEAWDMKYKKNIGWTHAWSSSPAHIIPRKLMGIEPLEPGFGRVNIQPRTGNLRYARIKLPTIRGTINVAIQNDPATPYTMQVEIPANMTARLALPLLGTATAGVVLDGQTVSGRIEGGRLVIDPLESGAHELTRKR